MSFRFFKRINLIGGLGLNLSKSGLSLSLRTPFGTIGQKGVSIRTGIPGLTVRTGMPDLRLRVRNLKERIGLSERKQTILLISEEFGEFGKVSGTSEEYIKNHAHIKRWNGVKIEYPSDDYNIVFNELSDLVKLGRDIQQYLQELIMLSSEHRTGITGQLRRSLAELTKLQDELENLLGRAIALKEEEDRKAPRPVAIAPEAASEPHADSGKEAIVHFACHECQQHLEVNSSASGQSFNCPSCGCELTVPSE